MAWPYVNADSLHIGHIAGAYLSADIFRRYHVLIGNHPIMVSGSDMHGTPVSVKAFEANKDPEEYAFSNHKIFINQLKALGFEYSNYTNTHTKLHFEVVNTIGKFLYKKKFLVPGKTKMFFDTKLKRVLPDRFVEGTCPYCGHFPARGDQCDGCGRILDPLELKDPKSKLSKTTPTIVEVTNLYLDLPKFAEQIKEYVKNSTHFRPHVREMTLGFLKEGLKPRPVTRNIQWGIPVEIEGFKDQVWYVWFEAVIGYLSATIEWSNFKGKPPKEYIGIYNPSLIGSYDWQEYWKDSDCHHYYFLGKDNIPFHTIIWPIQLMMFNERVKDKDISTLLPSEESLGLLNLPYDVVANHYMMLNGAKISKSTGNYISIAELLEKYDQTTIRWALARLLPETKDSNFTMERFKELVNNELLATIANLYYRVFSFVLKNYAGKIPEEGQQEILNKAQAKLDEILDAYSKVRIILALDKILELAKEANTLLNERAPWKDPQDTESKRTIGQVFVLLSALSSALWPVIPQFVEHVNSFLASGFVLSSHVSVVKDKVERVERLVERV